jgi:hypothetical protein
MKKHLLAVSVLALTCLTGPVFAQDSTNDIGCDNVMKAGDYIECQGMVVRINMAKVSKKEAAMFKKMIGEYLDETAEERNQRKSQ